MVLKGEEDIRRLVRPALLIADSRGINFLIRDRCALDPVSKKMLDRFPCKPQSPARRRPVNQSPPQPPPPSPSPHHLHLRRRHRHRSPTRRSRIRRTERIPRPPQWCRPCARSQVVSETIRDRQRRVNREQPRGRSGFSGLSLVAAGVAATSGSPASHLAGDHVLGRRVVRSADHPAAEALITAGKQDEIVPGHIRLARHRYHLPAGGLGDAEVIAQAGHHHGHLTLVEIRVSLPHLRQAWREGKLLRPLGAPLFA